MVVITSKNKFSICKWFTHIHQMKKTIITSVILIATLSCFAQTKLVQYIDTKIGVIDTRTSNCIIGPQLPYGSINPSPQTTDGGMGAYKPNQPVIGFGQMHVSGTGSSKYGHFLVSPQVGLAVGKGLHNSPASNEITTAYYYQANLDRYGIVAGVAPTHNAALYEFTYPTTDSACVVIDGTQTIKDVVSSTWFNYTVIQSEIELLPNKKQIRIALNCRGGWGAGAGPNKIYFIAEFEKPFAECGVWKDAEVKTGRYTMSIDENSGQRVGSFCRFSTTNGEKIRMKVAVSFTGFDTAEKFIRNEMTTWNIEDVKKAGMAAWEKKLSTIKIETPSEEQKKIFYTAMYHTMVQPRNRTGDNPNWKSDQPYWDDNFAIWDTWRSVYPLYMLIDPTVVCDNIKCFIDRFKHNGRVRDTFVAGLDKNEEQGGNDVDNVIAEAILKDVQGFDIKEAYALLKNNADKERLGLIAYNINNPIFIANTSRYKELGWIPESINSSSMSMEYSYNDYCVALIAKKLGKTADYEKYLSRSKKWTNLWNTNIESDGYKGFIDGRRADGTFLDQDAKKYGKSWTNVFYEASSWTYSYFVPHEAEKLISLMGGNEKYAERLAHAMDNKLINIGNEPAFWILRSFSHAGRPDLTSKWVHWMMKNNYDITGYTGNDDTGGMSSWYIFSALGFFPNAGQDYYYLSAPLYKKTVMTLGNGKTLTITAPDASEKNIYVQSCKINGKVWKTSMFNHKLIANGGTIEFVLSDQPGNWGK